MDTRTYISRAEWEKPMPTTIRIMTGLAVGALIYLALTGGILVKFMYGMWTVGVLYVGFTLARFLEE